MQDAGTRGQQHCLGLVSLAVVLSIFRQPPASCVTDPTSLTLHCLIPWLITDTDQSQTLDLRVCEVAIDNNITGEDLDIHYAAEL